MTTTPRIGMPTRIRVAPPTRTPATRRAPPVLAPTRGEVEVAAKAIAAGIGEEVTFAKEIFDFAIRSVATARATVEYAIFLTRCGVGESKISNPPRNKEEREEVEAPLNALRDALRDAREADKKIGGERILDSVPLGRKHEMTKGERQYLVEVLAPVFAPPEGTPLEEEIYRTVVGKGGWSLQLGDWLVCQFLEEEQLLEYAEALKAARAEDASSPAPEAEEVEETEAPEEEPAAQSA